MTAAWKKLRFILSVRSHFHMIDILSIAVHAFVSCVSMSFLVDETLLPRLVNLSNSFRELPLRYFYKECFNIMGCLNIHGTHMTTNKSTNNNVVLFLVSDLKIVYYNNY